MDGINIYDYNNFREFLKDYQVERYKVDKKFTKSAICKRLGLRNTRSYFGDVIKGKRVSPRMIGEFIRVFKLDSNQGDYFRALVNYNQCDEPGELSKLFEHLISSNKAPAKKLTTDMFKFYSKWYFNTVRAMLDIYTVKDNFSEIAQNIVPPLSVAEVKEAIQVLSSLGLIDKNEKGCWKPCDPMISSGMVSRAELVKNYQIESLKVVEKVLLQEDEKFRTTYTNVLSISDSALDKANKEVEKFKTKIRNIVRQDKFPAKNLIQLNLQMISQLRDR